MKGALGDIKRERRRRPGTGKAIRKAPLRAFSQAQPVKSTLSGEGRSVRVRTCGRSLVLGAHLRGDAISAADVERRCGSVARALMVTEPRGRKTRRRPLLTPPARLNGSRRFR